jgi:hypothetical protein
MAEAHGVSEATVQRIWKQHSLKPHLTKTFKLSRDKQFVEKLNYLPEWFLLPGDVAMRTSVQLDPRQIVYLLLVSFALTVPAAEAATGSAMPAPNVSLVNPGPIGQATTTAMFAQFAIGPDNTTFFTLLNTGTGPVSGNLILTSKDGNPVNVKLATGSIQATGATVPVSIPEGGVQFVTAAPISPTDPTITTGWARVESSGGTLGGVCTFQYAPGSRLQYIVGVLSSETVAAATIPVDDDAPNRATGFAVGNPSIVDTLTLKVQTVNADGTLGATLTSIRLGPGKQTASFFYQDAGASPTFKGSVVITEQSGKPFVIVALVGNQGLYTAIPVIPAKAPNIP